MNSDPAVTIVIPVYNGANYLAQAIDSALAQDLPGVEVVVVNDGSTDCGKTDEIAKAFLPRVRYFVQPNGGVASALNRGIAEARGVHVAWLSHDDLYRPDKVSRQVRFLQERSLSRTRTVIYGDFEVEDVNSGRRLIPAPPPPDGRAGEDARFLALLLEGRLHGCTMLLPRSCLREMGGFDERLRTTQDYDYWFRLLAAGYHFLHLPGASVISRIHAEQGTRTMSDIHLREVRELYAENVERFPALVAELGRASALEVLRAFEVRGQPDLGRRFRDLWAAGSPGRAIAAPAMGWVAKFRRS
jgi:glycosyltransferase involved in cell wall biosynthesis